MNLPGPRLKKSHLPPGGLLVTREAQWVFTLLGSCVAVTMFHPRFPLAAICHAMLPRPNGNGVPAVNAAGCFRYLSHAIPAMAARFSDLGLPASEVEVKMFGGGNVIDLGDPPDERSIGNANVTTARILLQSAGLQIKSESIGGKRGCKIVFNTATGQVLHKRLSRAASAP